jgi:hypothetical protein
MESGRVMRMIRSTFLVLGVFAAATCFGESRAVLIRGADSVKGMPFFPPNAITALYGIYSLGGSVSSLDGAPAPGEPQAAVWFTREAVVLGGAWSRIDVGSVAAYSRAEASGTVLSLKGAQYYLFFELPVYGPAEEAFILAFERKFLVFFDNAATDAELSFPAYVDY